MYTLKKIFKIDFEKLSSKINICSEKSNKSKIRIFIDMIICFILYGAGYVDYEFFDMYKLNRKERSTLITIRKNNNYVKKLNPKEYWKYIDDKALFNEKFKKYLNREFLKIDKDNFSDFEKFIKKRDEIIVKPIDATCGTGIEKIKIGEEDSKELFDRLLHNNQLLIEDVAKQHKDMSKLHASSVNTLRVVTIRSKYGVTSIIAAVCRMGTNNNVVDNFHSDGIYAPLDVNTGKIVGEAFDQYRKYYTKHPTTNIKLLGYQIPEWEAVKKLVIDAAEEIKELGYIGWDVCVGPKKPCLIEANQYPGHVLYKMINYNGVYGGIDPIFKEALNKRK